MSLRVKGQVLPVALPTVLIVVAGQRVHHHDGRHSAYGAGPGAHAGIAIRHVCNGQNGEDEQSDPTVLGMNERMMANSDIKARFIWRPFSVRRR